MAVVDDKDLYAASLELLRHYLSWREKLLGGYLAVMAGLAVAFARTRESTWSLGPGLPLLGLVLTVVFWLLERRNRQLFDRCIVAGIKIEKRAQSEGVLREINKESKLPTHGNVLDAFFGLASIALLAITFLSWRAKGS